MSDTNTNITEADLLAQIEALKAENNKLKAVKSEGLSFRVSAKRGVSVYGLGRFPVTLYKSQWDRLCQAVTDGSLPSFIAEAHARGELAVKEEKASDESSEG